MKIPVSEIELNHIFDLAEIQNENLVSLIKKVLSKISESHDIYEMGFAYIRERWTFSGEAGEVSENGEIFLDSKKLLNFSEEVAMAIIAHEFAHFHLKHYSKQHEGLEQEYEADDQARKWGFNVDEFRKVCGEPTMG
jgi:predicted metal-dependent hydrolase